MGLARSWCVALEGITGHLVEVEADLGRGIPGVHIVGLPDTALGEARDRVRAAVNNSKLSWPQKKITVNLSPATLRKAGSHFDLALAAAVLAGEAEKLKPEHLDGVVLLGELGLDGRVRRVRGVLPAVRAAAGHGFSRVAVPSRNVREAALVPGIEVVGVPTLAHLVGWLSGELTSAELIDVDDTWAPSAEDAADPPDLADIVGQPVGCWAAEVAAAGGHHLYLLGPPGAGKTMLAERLPGLLPDLPVEHALEVTAIHSVAGVIADDAPLVTRPPYRAPHHSATPAALVGGGSTRAGIRPGELSLAHRGVLLLDEAPEFARGMLDALRQPLESGSIAIARSAGTVRYPARITLVLAANPCPCGLANRIGLECRCSHVARTRYLARLSGPLLDRIDLRLQIDPVPRSALLGEGARAEPTAVVAARVAEARERAGHRLRGTPWYVNAEVPGPELRGRFAPAPDARGELNQLLEEGRLTGRGLDRVLRVAWTLADLAGRDRPAAHEVRTAGGLRAFAPMSSRETA